MEEDWSRIAGTSRPDGPSSSSNHALVFREKFCPEFWFQSSVRFGSHPHSAAPCRVPHWWCLCLPGGRFYFFSLFFFWPALTILFKPPQSVFPFTDGAESPASPWHPRVFLHLCLWGCSPPYRTQGEERSRHRKTNAASPQEDCNKTFRDNSEKNWKKKSAWRVCFCLLYASVAMCNMLACKMLDREQVCRKNIATLQTSNDKRTIRLTWLNLSWSKSSVPAAELQQHFQLGQVTAIPEILPPLLFISDSSGSQAAPSRHANLY